ncbi:Conserved Putative secreted protein [Sphingopyxis granuli]|uniref:Conserved Putative secreted protein n=1 Tax=Sphingopyxis granuli TaxID=267128 RepID=A0AA86GL47_9SPHN|nr:Conserved Putative secreted protein [Sphingopyxis granuli]
MFAMTLVSAAGGGTAEASQGSGAIAGLWSTGSNGGQVELYRCGAAICGKVVDAAPLRANPDHRDVKHPDRKLRERRLKGLVVLQGFEGGPAEWKGGPLYDPESGDGAAAGTLTLRADGKLEVKGCKAAIFCRTKIWTRAR